MTPTTPKINDPDIEKILNLLKAEFEPVELNIEYSKNSIINECYNNVQKQIDSKGGRRILGWQLWKSEHIIEAESHAVWEDKKGELHDITPKSDKVRTILFVEDDNINYDGYQIETLRINLTNNELVDHYIETFKAKFRFENIDERKNLYHLDFLASLSSFERQMHSALHLVQAKLESMIDSGEGMDSKCYCNSNKKYKNCHASKTLKMLNEF